MGFLYISMVCSYFSTVFIEFVLGVHRCFQCFYLCFHCLSILHGFVAIIFIDFHVFNGLEPINKYIIYIYIYIYVYIYICMYVCMHVWVEAQPCWAQIVSLDVIIASFEDLFGVGLGFMFN